MGWFDEQIRMRKLTDDQVFEETFSRIAGAVTGERIARYLEDNRIQTSNAIEEIIKYYHGKIQELPEAMDNVNEQLDYQCRPNGIARRTVELTEKWYTDAVGAFLAVKTDGTVVALLPNPVVGYHYIDPDTGKMVLMNKKRAQEFEREAFCFYKPLPLKKINPLDLLKFGFSTWSILDQAIPILLTFVISMLAILLPKISHFLVADVVEEKRFSLLLSTVFFWICLSLTSQLISSVKGMLSSKANTKMGNAVEAATMMRILSLPASFFKKYSSGELEKRTQYVSVLCSSFMDIIFGTTITSLFSLLSVSQIFLYAPSLVVPSLIVILATVAFSILTTLVQMRLTKKQMEISAKESGMSYAMITGVQKIKLSGAEKRAFSRWGNLYAESAKLSYNPPLFLKLNGTIGLIISTVGSIVLYFLASQTKLSVADWWAFQTAYATVGGAFMAIAEITSTVADIKPTLEMAKPILETEPEVSEGRTQITKLSGGVELNNVSFRYDDSMPMVIDNLSLKIKPGQYVAIVGKTGCGKSTLMRLMLGFETPQKGAIYYDGKDLKQIDVKSLRRRIGTVMQDGKLFSGDIFSNITISAPWLTMDEAWEAAEMAGMADDIRSMPMGMNTLISEGAGGISGGQRQRLMIARAVAPKPKILMFDEATSALDNITQKTVSESLDNLHCTRIVIAHRLSTIRHCDRIILLDHGQIAEDGTYDELIKKKGAFAELVSRQLLNQDAE